MSAAELIEQIKALPPAELEIVRNFMLNGDTASAVRYASDTAFQEVADSVFEKHEELLRKLAQ